MQERVRVGAAQVAPQFFDKRKTLEKTVGIIEEAGRLGLDLLVFPETYFAAYPFWRGAVSVRRSTELIVEMQRHAIRADGEEARVIADAARRAKVHCVVGCNELDDRVGSLTLYNTLLFVGRDGKIKGRHRKLMPTTRSGCTGAWATRPISGSSIWTSDAWVASSATSTT